MLFTDSSLSGWGAHIGGEEFGGIWNSSDTKQHINFLELKCVRLVLQHLAKRLTRQHIHLFTDN